MARKLPALRPCLVLALALAACSGKGESKTGPTSTGLDGTSLPDVTGLEPEPEGPVPDVGGSVPDPTPEPDGDGVEPEPDAHLSDTKPESTPEGDAQTEPDTKPEPEPTPGCTESAAGCSFTLRRVHTPGAALGFGLGGAESGHVMSFAAGTGHPVGPAGGGAVEDGALRLELGFLARLPTQPSPPEGATEEGTE